MATGTDRLDGENDNDRMYHSDGRDLYIGRRTDVPGVAGGRRRPHRGFALAFQVDGVFNLGDITGSLDAYEVETGGQANIYVRALAAGPGEREAACLAFGTPNLVDGSPITVPPSLPLPSGRT
jgi:hypothetical protein